MIHVLSSNPPCSNHHERRVHLPENLRLGRLLAENEPQLVCGLGKEWTPAHWGKIDAPVGDER